MRKYPFIAFSHTQKRPQGDKHLTRRQRFTCGCAEQGAAARRIPHLRHMFFRRSPRELQISAGNAFLDDKVSQAGLSKERPGDCDPQYTSIFAQFGRHQAHLLPIILAYFLRPPHNSRSSRLLAKQNLPSQSPRCQSITSLFFLLAGKSSLRQVGADWQRGRSHVFPRFFCSSLPSPRICHQTRWIATTTTMPPIIQEPINLARPDAELQGVVKILHPDYSAAENTLLHLAAVDDGGIDYDTALVACGIVAGNKWTGFLATRNTTAALVPVPRPSDGILRGRSAYFFQLPDSDAPQRPYPVVVRFSDWVFPHSSLPSPWCQLRRSPSNDDATCRVTDSGWALEKAHLVPLSVQSWFDREELEQYA